jgi:outer membrane protein assembly factor BamA
LFDWSRRALRVVLATLALLGLVMPPAYSQNEGPAPTVVSVSVTGNTHISADRILAVVQTKPGDPFDPAKIQADLRAINDLGFFADQAPPVIKQRPDGIAITFRVVENPVVDKIVFNGNAHVPADTLLALMDTATGQVFNSKTFQQDVLKINSYYDKIGYRGQVPSHVADVNIQPDGTLSLKITEGLTVRNVVIAEPPAADPVLSAAVIKAVLQTKPGTPYSEETSDKDVERLKELYKRYDLTIGDFEAGIDPATIDMKAGTADVVYTISVMRIAAIEITGNTLTHDDVIRRELRLKPGDQITDSGIRRDYDRLNNLGFFEKVSVDTGPGPDPKKPAYITLKWTVKEQRTGQAQIGAGYSGGITGTGLTGQVSYTQNNINGTGDGGSIRFERGSRLSDASISFSVPYVGKTQASQRYSFGGTIYTQAQTNYYPVYYVPTPAPVTSVTGLTPIPVTIIPTNESDAVEVDGIASTYQTRSSGLNLTLGRRLSDIFRVSVGTNLAVVASSAQVPEPYYFPNNNIGYNVPVGTSNADILNELSSAASATNALGINAPSIANIDSTRPYNLRSIIFGTAADTRDDIFNPRRGINASISDEVSEPEFGSAFRYSVYVVDVAKFFPVLRNATFGIHARAGLTDGAIPPNKLFTFSDQQLRGYNNPFYGTDEELFQAELRVPVTADRKFAVVGFFDDGGVRIRGAEPLYNTDGTVIDYSQFQFHSDVGIGLRFDIPQLGLKTIRLDFAKGTQGTHTAFGIGQSF